MKGIAELFYDYNPWWQIKGFSFPETNLVKRILFPRLEEYLNYPQIVAILGLRRTGKTTALKQLINLLLTKGVEPKNILFFPFEESGIIQKRETLEDVFYQYIEGILKKKVYEVNDRIYLFLDEVQYIPAWQEILKRYYDLNKNFKFVISGSSSLFIRDASSESLAGRILEIKFRPFAFTEYLVLKRESTFPYIEITGDLNDFLKKKDEIQDAIYSSYNKFMALFKDYLIKGQFPEAVDFPLLTYREYLHTSIWSKILEKDIPKIFRIEKIEELKQFFFNACRESSNLYSPYGWCSDLGISLLTIDKFINCLEKSNLARRLYNFSKGFRKGHRSLKKIFVTSPNFVASVLGVSEDNPLFTTVLGRLVETAIFSQIQDIADIYFWREREKEVDFILSFPEGILPLEVKFKKDIKTSDFSTLLYMMKNKKQNKGVLITNNQIGLEDISGYKIYKIPAMAVL